MKNKKNIIVSALLLSAVMVLSACGSSAKADEP